MMTENYMYRMWQKTQAKIDMGVKEILIPYI